MARADLQRIGEELRQTRMASGLSIREVAAESGISATQVWRIERARLPGASVDQLARVGAAVGLDVRVRGYPGGDPLRDAGQVRLMDRLRRHVHTRLGLRTEVPLPAPGDPRAWDGRISGLIGGLPTLPVEAETRFTDAQAQTRRIFLKLRDAGEEHVLVVLADTPANRAAVAAAAPVIRDQFPIPARSALRALAAGRHPGGSALVFI